VDKKETGEQAFNLMGRVFIFRCLLAIVFMHYLYLFLHTWLLLLF